MAMFFLSNEAINLDEIEHIDLDKKTVRFTSGREQRLTDAEFQRVLAKFKGGN